MVETQGTQRAINFLLSLQPVAQPVRTSEEWEERLGCAQRKEVVLVQKGGSSGVHQGAAEERGSSSSGC